MSNILKSLEEFRRLDRLRRDGNLPTEKKERWKELREILDSELGGPGGEERRQEMRAELPTMKVRYKSGQTFRDNYLKNLSTGGVYIKTKNPMPLGTQLNLIFDIAEKNIKFNVIGTVVWEDTKGTGDRPSGMGVKFFQVKPEVADQIEKLVYGTISEKALETDKDKTND